MEQYKIIPCNNVVGEWEISPTHETFDTRQQAEERLKELQSNDYKQLIKILDFEFNHKLDFANQKPKEVIDYVKDFLEGKTEYDISNLFPKDEVLSLINKLDEESEVLND